MKIFTFSTFKKEQFPRKLFVEIRQQFCSIYIHLYTMTFQAGATSATMVFFDEILLSRMPLKSSLIVVKNAPILLAQLETGHMSVALMRGRQAKQSPNPNIHSRLAAAYHVKIKPRVPSYQKTHHTHYQSHCI